MELVKLGWQKRVVYFCSFLAESKVGINVENRLKTLTERGKKPLIYHQVNVTSTYFTMNVQVKVDKKSDTRLVVFGKHAKMPLVTNCDFLKVIGSEQKRDGKFRKNNHQHLS